VTRRHVEVVALDADDTLWHSEIYFEETQRTFQEVVGRHVDDEAAVADALPRVEGRNLARYGYGIKGFTLSMLEAAIEVTGGAVTTTELDALLAAGRAMLDPPVDLLDGVAETVEELRDHGYRLLLVTKGDLHHQEHKIAASGLTPFFERLEIVTEKDPATYRRVIDAAGVAPRRFAMVGNSVRSDVLPVLDLGAHAVHVPYHLTWAHEHVHDADGVPSIATIRELPGWLESR